MHRLLVYLIAPPVGAGVFWIMGNAWIHATEGVEPSQRVKRWLNLGFWVVLVVSYVAVLIIAVTGYRYHPR